jgi:predicted ATPase
VADGSDRARAPASRTAFFGRERERARLSELVRRGPLVTVTGVGGVGKTRMTAEVLATEADPQLVRWCFLTAIDDDDSVPGAVASALGRDTTAGEPGQAVVDVINERGLLVVLDNCEHVVRGVAELAERVLSECPDARLVATSREPLGVDGEAVLALGPLELPERESLDDVAASEAVALFLDRARLARWDFELDASNADAVLRICRRLDGLPLALELAAARVRSLSPGEIAEHLDSRFALLARARSRGSERHRTLRAAVDWSYRLLDEPERLVFERLAVFASGCDLDAAAAVCAGDGVEPGELLDLLDRLVERSLLRAGEGGGRTRYGMLETLRHYGADRLAERGEDARRRTLHAEHYAGRADRARRDGENTWSGAMLRDGLAAFDEIRAAARWSMRQERSRERALRLLAPLWALAHTAHATEIAELCDEALRSWPVEHDDLGQALLGTAAVAGFVSGRPDVAMARARTAIEAEAGGASPAVVARRAVAVVTYGFMGDVPGGLERLAEVVRAAHEAGMPAIALEMSVLRAQALAAAGRVDEALGEAEALRVESERLDSPFMLAWSVYVLGTIRLAAGADGAEACFAESLRLARESDFHFAYGTSLRQMGAVAVRDGRDSQAAARLADAYEHFHQRGDVPQAWDVLRTAATLFARRGHTDRAAEALAGAAADPRARRPAPLEAAGLAALAEELGEALVAAAVEPRRLEELGPELLEGLRKMAEEADGAARASAAARPASAAGAPAEPAGAPAEPAGAPAEPAGAPAEPAAAAAAPAGPAPAAPTENLFRRDGPLWTLSFDGRTVHLPDLKGLHDLARLLAAPGEDLHCLELAGAPGLPPQGDAGPLLDERARADYRRRMQELGEEAERAEAAGDTRRAEAAREELDTLTDAVAAAFGLGGRPRKAGDPAERARSTVTARIRSAVAKVEEAHPALGRHLQNSVRTGTFCSYRPERPPGWVT